MIPPTSKTFLVNNLAAGTLYDLCVLAIYDDGITSLTATRVVGCTQFSTEQDYVRCHFMQSQFLGGTMIIVIGGVIVASVLVFIIILMIRYKVCHGGEQHKAAKVSNVYSQTNGAQAQQGCSGGLAPAPSGSRQAVGLEEGLQGCKAGGEGAAQASDGCPGQDCSSATSSGPQAWTPGLSASQKLKRKSVPRPGEGGPGEGAGGPGLESQNTNRNNSTALQGAAPTPPDCPQGPPLHKRAQAKPSKFLTLPADPARARRRYSLNGGLTEYRCCVGPSSSPQAGGFWSRRSLSMNGMLVPTHGAPAQPGRAALSRSEWILESTV